jgi:gluconate 5-dehydrogenase
MNETMATATQTPARQQSDRFASLEGRAVAITGASRGLGRAIALGFAASGARLLLGARSRDDGEEVADLIRKRGGVASAHSVDVTDRKACEAFVNQAVSLYGALEVMVCNAGICIPKPALETDAEMWQQTMDVDLTGAFNSAVAAGRRMIAQGAGGSIVFISSNAAFHGFEKLTAYCAAKAAVNQLVRSLAQEWGPLGIRVNGVAPGWTNHVMRENESLVDEETVRTATDRTPLRRFGEAEEIVGPTLFLASSAASFVSGTTLAVDGGYGAV